MTVLTSADGKKVRIEYTVSDFSREITVRVTALDDSTWKTMSSEVPPIIDEFIQDLKQENLDFLKNLKP